MIFATFDLEVLDDGPMLRLERARPEWPWWYLRLVAMAKRANEKGRILQGRTPVTADDLAMVHHRDPDRAQEWQEMLDRCVSLGLLTVEGDTYSIAQWRRWHRSPSDEPDQAAERKARSRDLSIPRVTSRDNNDVTNVTTHSRAEHSIAEQRESIAEQPQSIRARTREEAAAVVSDCFLPMRSELGLVGGRQASEVETTMEWASDPLMEGRAIEDDIRVAAEYARDATLHRIEQGKPVKSRWRYANRIAADHLQEIIARRQTREVHARLGLPDPKPYLFSPDDHR